MRIQLPEADGSQRSYTLRGGLLKVGAANFSRRIAFAAAHVVVDPLKTVEVPSPVIDWESTLAFRRHLWSLGFCVAEAMDTAQRGMGLHWPQALELIQRASREAKASGGAIASGVGTDHLGANEATSLDDIVAAYLLQAEAVEACGSRIILMASRALARIANCADDYFYVYGEVLRQVSEPVILHWLGPMFDPRCQGIGETTPLRPRPERVWKCFVAMRGSAMASRCRCSTLNWRSR